MRMTIWFFSNFMHQDWILEYADLWAAVKAVPFEQPLDAQDLLKELRAIKAAGLDEDTLRVAIESGDTTVSPEYWGVSYTEWIDKSIEILERELAPNHDS